MKLNEEVCASSIVALIFVRPRVIFKKIYANLFHMDNCRMDISLLISKQQHNYNISGTFRKS